MPVKIALLKQGASQLLGQLVQVGLVAATWQAMLAMAPCFKIIDFSEQASFATASSFLPRREFRHLVQFVFLENCSCA